MQAVLLDFALVAVGCIIGVRHARVASGIGEREVAGFQGIALVISGDRAEPQILAGAVKPFAGQAQAVEIGMLAIALGIAPGDKVVLADIAGLDAGGELAFIGGEAAAGAGRRGDDLRRSARRSGVLPADFQQTDLGAALKDALKAA